MPKIDVGICTNILLKNFVDTDVNRLFCLFLSEVFESKNVQPNEFYLYNSQTDCGQYLSSMNEILEHVSDGNYYNQISGCYDSIHYLASISTLDSHLAFQLTLDYSDFSKQFHLPSADSILSYLHNKLCALYQKYSYQFAFLDFDAEFDIEYRELLQMAIDGICPYCLLLISEQNTLLEYRSGFDLLGCK